MIIEAYGWDDYFQKEWDLHATEFMIPARVIADYGQMLQVITNMGEMRINRPLHKDDELIQVAVGDFIAIKKHVQYDEWELCFVLKRKTKFSRAASGDEVKEQIVASNVDTLFLVQSLNKDFNMKRLERYLLSAWESGAMPVIILSKADCCDAIDQKIAKVYMTAPGVNVHTLSCVTGEGLDTVKGYFSKGKTIALLGSSGVGKSTLVNTLFGEELLKTQTIREDDSRGRHTTTHRQLVLLPDGGLILDTPGMRSFLPWKTDSGNEVMYGDIEELINCCRFADCTHGNEPGCAIREALESGVLEKGRYESWLKMKKEQVFLERKRRQKQRMIKKQKGKPSTKYQRL